MPNRGWVALRRANGGAYSSRCKISKRAKRADFPTARTTNQVHLRAGKRECGVTAQFPAKNFKEKKMTLIKDKVEAPGIFSEEIAKAANYL